MSQKDLISVIVPFWNVDKYIASCLDSITEQTYKNLEIICIDDCGTDSSINIVKEYAERDHRIKIVTHKKNKGIGPSRNTGIKHTKGKYTLFIDPDDTISENLIDSMYKSAIKNKSDIVFGNVELVYDSYKVKPRAVDIKKYLAFIPEEPCFTIDNSNFSFYLDKLPCVVWNKLFITSFLKDNNLKFIDIKISHEDEGFHTKVLANKPKFSYVDNTTLYYLIREKSLMDEAEKEYQEKLKNIRIVINDSIEYIKNNNKDSSLIELIRERPIFNQAYTATNLNFRNLRKLLFQIKLKKNLKIIKLFGIRFYEKKY